MVKPIMAASYIVLKSNTFLTNKIHVSEEACRCYKLIGLKLQEETLPSGLNSIWFLITAISPQQVPASVATIINKQAVPCTSGAVSLDGKAMESEPHRLT